jgi:hypothetical protein
MLLVGGVNNGNYPLGRGLWTALPLLTILFLFIGAPVIDGQSIGDVFKALEKDMELACGFLLLLQ